MSHQGPSEASHAYVCRGHAARKRRSLGFSQGCQSTPGQDACKSGFQDSIRVHTMFLNSPHQKKKSYFCN